VESVVPPAYPYFKLATTPIPLLQKLAGITPAIKSTIPSVTKKSQRANHAVTEIRMTRTSSNDSHGIYTMRVGRREGEVIPYCIRDCK